MIKPKPDLRSLRHAVKDTATPAVHDTPPPAQEPAEPTPTHRRGKGAAKTQLVGAHLSPDVGKQLRILAAEEDTDVKALLIEAINMLFKSRGRPQIAK
jgi:hypothetical protein